MRCRCNDIANCENDIAVLGDVLGVVGQASGRFGEAAQDENQMLNKEREAYSLNSGIRAELERKVNNDLYLIADNIVGAMDYYSGQLSALTAECCALKLEDKEYHEYMERLRREEEERARQNSIGGESNGRC